MQYDPGGTGMIYISYSHSDRGMVSVLSRELSLQGYQVWFDMGTNGADPWWKLLNEKIRRCDVFIVLITKSSIASPNTLKEVVFALEKARERDKIIIPAVFDADALRSNMEWMLYLGRYHWVICDTADPSWINKISEVVARTYGNGQRRRKLYEEYSELLKSQNTLYASMKLTEIMDLILLELEDCMASERNSLLMELDRCLEQTESLYRYDYSPEARAAAEKRLKTLDRIYSLPELKQEDVDDIFSLACAIRLLYWEREIRWQCADTVTGGDVSDGIVKTLPESEYAKKQAPYRALFMETLASDDWKADCSEAETEYILHAGDYLYEQSQSQRREKPVLQTAETPDEKMESIARYIQDGNHVFELIGRDEKAADFLRCLITSYERLKNYCDVVGARKISAECIERIAELKQRFLQSREEKISEATKAEKGIKALLGLTLPGSGEYDVFLSHKSEDEDIAGYVYGFLKSNLKEVFFDKVSLPEISKTEYRKAIMNALDHSKHFIVIVTKIETLQDTKEKDWVKTEMETFHAEIDEGRKPDSNFIILATDEVYDQVVAKNKRNIYIDWRKYTILKTSEYRETLMQYLK